MAGVSVSIFLGRLKLVLKLIGIQYENCGKTKSSVGVCGETKSSVVFCRKPKASVGVCIALKKYILLGIGNELRGDDGIGPYVADNLFDDDWLVLNCGTAPGNFTQVVKRHKPELVVMVDAAEMGLQPGQYRRLSLQATHGSIDAATIGISAICPP